MLKTPSSGPINPDSRREGTVSGRLLLCQERGTTNRGPVRAGMVAGRDLLPERVPLLADFREGGTTEGTRQLLAQGRADQRAAVCANGPVESVPVQAQTNPLPCIPSMFSRGKLSIPNATRTLKKGFYLR